MISDFTNGVEDFLLKEDQHDALLANYWLSGSAAHKLKHSLNMPLLTSFHTLARVKAVSGDKSFGYDERITVES